MQAEDWVRILNLFGSVVLFYGSYRNQQWVKIQADREDEAAESRSDRPTQERTTRGSSENRPDSNDFDRVAAEALSRPYFDRFGYVLLCFGFAVSSIASLLDIASHSKWVKHLFGVA